MRGAREETLRELAPHCEALVKAGAISRVRGGEAFPYEGTAVLLSRHAAMLTECELKYRPEEKEEVREKVRAACRGINGILSALKPQDKPQEPYCSTGSRQTASISGGCTNWLWTA